MSQGIGTRGLKGASNPNRRLQIIEDFGKKHTWNEFFAIY